MQRSYYIPIKSANLPHYFVRGCIAPSTFIENRIDDIQTQFENHTLISDDKYVNDSNCSVEIVLSNEDDIYEIAQSFYLLTCPIPISRIKKIFFQSQEQCQNTMFDINNGAAFLPQTLVAIDNRSNATSISTLKDFDYTKLDKVDWEDKIDKFDRVLGGFSVMKETNDDDLHYSLNYFKTLSLINSLVKDELEAQLHIQLLQKNNYKFAIFKEEKYSTVYEHIYSPLTEEKAKAFAKTKDGITLFKKNGKILLDKIDPAKFSYVIATLASYGSYGSRMSIDNFFSDLRSDKFPNDKKEGLALLFGINKGYYSLRNKYQTKNFTYKIKFELTSKLDYYTIESIYQFAFNNKTNNTNFSYLDGWIPTLDNAINLENHTTYHILDQEIKLKEQRFPFAVSFEEIYQKTDTSKLFNKIISSAFEWIPEYLNIDKDRCKSHFTNAIDDEIRAVAQDMYTYTANIYLSHIEQLKQQYSKAQNELQSEIEDYKTQISEIKSQKSPKNSINKIQHTQNKLNKIQQLDEKRESSKAEEFTGNIFGPNTHRELKREKLALQTLKSLKEKAKELGVRKLSKYNRSNKVELIDIIIDNEKL